MEKIKKYLFLSIFVLTSCTSLPSGVHGNGVINGLNNDFSDYKLLCDLPPPDQEFCVGLAIDLTKPLKVGQ